MDNKVYKFLTYLFWVSTFLAKSQVPQNKEDINIISDNFIKFNSIDIEYIDEKALIPLLELIGDRMVVLLGEFTHGDGAFHPLFLM